MSSIGLYQLQKVAIIAMYCHYRIARRDSIINILLGFRSELCTNPVPFHLESLWSATLIPIRVCAMDCADKNSDSWLKHYGSFLNRLWTEAREILGQCRRHFVLSSAVA